MKLGVLTLWTNGMSATPALAPRATSKRDEVAPLSMKTAEHASRLDDVLGTEAKPLFAVDDLAYALPVPPASSKPAPSRPGARRKPKAQARGKKRAVARSHA